MWLMVVPGVIALAGGVGFLCAPQRMTQQAPAPARFWIQTDPFFLKYRISTAIVLIGMGFFCLSSALYVWMRLHV